MQTDSAEVTTPSPTTRSAVTNGSRLLPNVDGRSCWARRTRDVLHAHLSDLGGVENTSESERSIIRRASVLTTELEMLEQRFALAGGEASANDLDLYQRTATSLRRLLEGVGLGRRQKPTNGSDNGLGVLLGGD